MNRHEITGAALNAAQKLSIEMLNSLRANAPALYARAVALKGEGATLEIAFRFDADQAAHIVLSVREQAGDVHELGIVTVGSTRAH